MRILENKSNWICECKMIRAILKEIRKKNSLNVYMKENLQNVYNRDAFTTKYFYDINFQTAAIQIKYTKEFQLRKQDWQHYPCINYIG